MSDSDGDFEAFEDDDEPSIVTNGYGTRGRTGAAGATGATRERWEDVQRTWDQVEESADGTLTRALESLQEAQKRRRVLRDTTPLQRGIIRHVVLLLDMSSAMSETDLKPTRLGLTLTTSAAFVTAFFEQNPISQLAIVITRDGLAQRLTDLSGSPAVHLAALDKLRPKPNPEGKSGYTAEIEVIGNPSLENSLALSRGMLSAAPSHGTKEIIIVYAALLTADPGNIHDTIRNLVQDRIRVSVVGLAARLRILSELVARTHDLPSASAPQASSDALYGVVLDETHFRSLLLSHTTPPPTTSAEHAARKPSMIPMDEAEHRRSESDDERGDQNKDKSHGGVSETGRVQVSSDYECRTRQINSSLKTEIPLNLVTAAVAEGPDEEAYA
ncbi:MAG: hypothetical protein Q9162_007588 [Coniocarpon cinnabarinum]